MTVKNDWVNGQTVDAAALNAVANAVNANTAAISAGAGTVGAVIVATGHEARPTGPMVVLWVDPREDATRPDNMGGNDLWFAPGSAISSDIVAPSTPTGLVTSATTSSGFTASWSAATDAVGVTGYQVRSSSSIVTPTSLSGATLTYTFSGLSSGTSYSWQVRARDAAGNFSTWATVASPAVTTGGTDTTPPTVPTGLASSSITNTSFNLSWTASTDAVGVTGYRVKIDGVPYSSPTGTSDTVTGRTAGTTYNVTVEARDAAANYSAPSTVLAVTTTGISIPTPLSHFDFHEGSGSTTTDIVSGFHLTATTPASAWGSGGAVDQFQGYIASNGTPATINQWSMVLELAIPSLPAGEKSFLLHGSSIFWNILTDGKIKWYPSSGTPITSTATISTGAAHKLGIVTTATGTRIFMDGTLIVSDSAPLPWLAGAPDSSFILPDSANLVGVIDNVRFWNVALSDGQVAAL